MKALALIILITGALLSGCIGQAGTQRYHLSTNSSIELILYPDSTFNLNLGDYTFSGDYNFDNDTLYLKTPLVTDRLKVINDSALQYKDSLYLKD